MFVWHFIKTLPLPYFRVTQPGNESSKIAKFIKIILILSSFLRKKKHLMIIIWEIFNYSSCQYYQCTPYWHSVHSVFPAVAGDNVRSWSGNYHWASLHGASHWDGRQGYEGKTIQGSQQLPTIFSHHQHRFEEFSQLTRPECSKAATEWLWMFMGLLTVA